ncbi:MAG: 2-polyprenyl-3-methyl-5-hydroxy-6-metoxy-1,4-benzoquinol methylase [Verrucomicrobiales bacterium]|jgi:2-polyprenyl-3-methyl-5-hydroxy-6-metoxy-1,4-benzoquinol methylase
MASTNEGISKIYVSGEYHDKNPSFHVEDSPWKADQICKMLDGHKIQPKHICEIGCGAGEILNQLHQRLPDGTEFSGYELSPQAFEMCQPRAKPRLNFYNANLFETPPPQKFDLMLCMDVFEHIEDYFQFLRNLSQHATQFIFHIPLDMNMQMVGRAEPIRRVRESVGHLHYFSKDTALAALSDTGFQVKDWFYTPNGVDRPKTTRARLAKLPRLFLSKLNQDLTARFLGGYSLLALATNN